MRKLSFILLFLLSYTHLLAQVGIGTNNPDNSAMLEVSATDKGLLPPRVALTSIISASPITSPATGLLVFNTATAGTTPNNVVPGYYYWSGSAWIKLSIPADNAANVSGTVAVSNGGTGATTAAGARTNLGATTVGSNLFTLPNQTAIRFPRINADNTVSTLTDAEFRTAIGAGTGNGTVTSVGLTTGTSGTDVNVSGSPVTGSGTITLNIPDASATARGLVTTGTQTFAGAKTFSAAPVFSTATASQALFTDGSKNVVSNSITGTGSVVMSNSATLSTPKINTSSSSASAAGAGALRYNSSNLEYSNGSSWRPLATVEVDNTYKLASTGTARSVDVFQEISSGSFVTLNNSSITVVVPSGFSDTRIILQWNVWGEVKANAAATGSIRYQIRQTSPTSSTIQSVMMTGWSISSGSVTRFSAPVGWIIVNAVAGTYTFELQMNRESESGNAPFDFLNWGIAGTGQVFVR